jgi:ABC-type ATPase with predicted acetyltransferase domain
MTLLRGRAEIVEVKISEEPEPIDVFSEQMKVSSVLNLENLDVDANYIERQNLLRTSFNAHLPTIQRLYQQ